MELWLPADSSFYNTVWRVKHLCLQRSRNLGDSLESPRDCDTREHRDSQVVVQPKRFIQLYKGCDKCTYIRSLYTNHLEASARRTYCSNILRQGRCPEDDATDEKAYQKHCDTAFCRLISFPSCTILSTPNGIDNVTTTYLISQLQSPRQKIRLSKLHSCLQEQGK